MNEQDLRSALRAEMSAATRPPSMNGTEVLDAARRADRKRKAGLAGLGAAGAVAAIAAGAMLLPGLGGTDTDTIAIGAPGKTTSATTAPPTKTSWPNGQPDRTATAGPRYDRAVELLDLLTDALPKNYSEEDGWHQAQFDQYDGDREAWEYAVTIKSEVKPTVMATVFTPGNSQPETPCAREGSPMRCEPLMVDGKQVWIVTYGRKPAHVAPMLGASYRHPDGTVVQISMEGNSEFPFTKQALAELTVSSRFALS
ncbi:hypothetical protein [Alloactinosynnema sp. L-07]|uniref:hypothetical protein n=1 Tax=Alloactinosynnema sp. L-07 TaxID=1653480 RepID=UPI00065EF8E7|nr:hypothetical protein [Alloactinosynnema sp. L-07]CRK60325.1 hypothetical protein [Alloactinosynnema sp. L-07]